jgi:hypothetical protein
MKTLLQQTNEESGAVYETYAEIKSSDYPTNLLHLEFSSVWSGSKNPKEHQKRFEFLLTKDAAKTLINLLNEHV